jgi:transglutaminase-like putative cysteine protease
MLKSSQPAIGLVAYRADRRRALQPLAPTADLFQELIVKVDPPLAKPHERDHATYDVQLASGAPAEVFAADYRQQWQPLGNKRARLQATATWADDWKERTTTTGATPPADALTANKLIDCHHPRVVELANSVAHDETDAWQTAQQLERLVNDAITEKNLESAFAAASTVATDRAGDCTEHAVLLAALCRARDIPARVAVGLVYVDSLDGFLYHMWNEVWIDGQWRPLDATFGRGGVGATHLKISDSLLDEDNAYASMLPVVNVIGQVKIREVGGQSSEVREIPE